jgi:hypothetical protein
LPSSEETSAWAKTRPANLYTYIYRERKHNDPIQQRSERQIQKQETERERERADTIHQNSKEREPEIN